MRDQAIAIAMKEHDPERRRNALREYVQACVLRSLHESEAFRAIAFVGGTALRFLENLPRFSEDLDFSLAKDESYDPVAWMGKLKRDLSLAGFDPLVRWNDSKTVHTGWVRVPGLLQEAGLSGHAKQKLSIKLEVDTRPPAGADTARAVITRHFTFVVGHYDLPSLMAGKLHAILTRSYPKGRDWFDLLWYGSRRPPVEPNLPLLQNALDQTEGAGVYDSASWRILAAAKLDTLDADALIRDVQPFLERSADALLLTAENLKTVLHLRNR